ncbi:hypothetical protein IU500_24600 [Nocardia terpenica]|uniref:hypothetical protein n=1 Tax=Nocardia terpenica TaxID=455432 RepID=UPI001894DE88|nr:hypothetical protein [Nocardia terpenica]MBF6064681.1 hypothetical protein [Nocardia terpenica]MBF6107197.1 hypothetical protein [Nocardia terpenica]MBF6114955.1 hypothetical protein [Nocardia terpenica]MBF6122060.1 hypothetical protein [Nocardia terpenica]MBF6154443.1 hypothetical protein [Nocardia terpenica]
MIRTQSCPRRTSEFVWIDSVLHNGWRQVGGDPFTLTSNIAGFVYLRGFKRCGGHDTPPTYEVDVW